MDADDYRSASRDQLGAAGRRLGRAAPTQLRAAALPVSTWMVDAIGAAARPDGARAGRGPGRHRASRRRAGRAGRRADHLGPRRRCSTAAQRRARGARPATTSSFRQLDAEVDRPRRPRSVDAVLCRWGYMLMADPEAALRETRRVLRPGGRARARRLGRGRSDNPWARCRRRELVAARAGRAARPGPARPGSSPWAPRGRDRASTARGRRLHRACTSRPLELRVAYVLRRLVGRRTLDLVARFADAVGALARRDRATLRAGLERAPRGLRRRGTRSSAVAVAAADAVARRDAPRDCRTSRLRPAARDSLPRMFYDDDADLTLLDGKTVAIIGYGSQGHAHALNLKDSGVDVVVGLRERLRVGRARRASRASRCCRVAEAASRGDIVMILLPDEQHREVWEPRSATGSRRATCCCSATASRSTTARSRRPPSVDVALVAPKGPGHLVRRQFLEGSGVPGLIAVEQDATGNARALALAYAKGIGCTRGGVIETTLQGRDRDRPVRRAGRAVRRRLRARAGGLRDARRGRLRPATGVLRVPARAQADRRPDVREGHHRDALLDLQHGRVRRPHARQARHHRRDARRR